MLKIQHGIAGFFSGAFIGFLIGLAEMRLFENSNHPARLFLAVVITVLGCGLTGLIIGLKRANKKI